MTLVIGLTGSIATGKSTVSAMFRDLNIHVIDADQIAREVVEPGEKAYREVVDHFGESILQEDRTLNRQKLGSIVFADASKRVQLNNIIHPAIRKKMLEQRDALIKAEEKCVVLDIPLLFESNLTNYVEKIMVVFVDEKTQLIRLMKRDNLTKEEALERINSQLPIKEKVDLADATIDNSGTVEHSLKQLKDILATWNVLS